MILILIIMDDFADAPAFTRQSNMLHTLYIRGRQHMISTIIVIQTFYGIRPFIRANSTELFVYWLRNMKDILRLASVRFPPFLISRH